MHSEWKQVGASRPIEVPRRRRRRWRCRTRPSLVKCIRVTRHSVPRWSDMTDLWVLCTTEPVEFLCCVHPFSYTERIDRVHSFFSSFDILTNEISWESLFSLCANVTSRRRRGRVLQIYIFLIQITSLVDWAMFVCMSTQILVIIRARDTKFGM